MYGTYLRALTILLFCGTASAQTAATLRGINLSGLEFSPTTLPGTIGYDYDRLYKADMAYLYGRGHRVIRVPFSWERLQPVPGGALNTAYQALLMQAIEDAGSVGLKVILDMHNFCSYQTGGVSYKIGSPMGPSAAQFANAWQRISAFVNSSFTLSSAVIGYDLMNEPNYCAPPPITYSPTYLYEGFESGSGYWSGSNGTTMTWDNTSKVTGRGSLRLVKTLAAGSTDTLDVRANAGATNLRQTNGAAVSIDVTIPATAAGNYYAALTVFQAANGYAPDTGPQVLLKKGTPTTVATRPNATTWSNPYDLYLQIFSSGRTTRSQVTAYVDNVRQGTGSMVLSVFQAWEAASQAAVSAIRQNGDSRAILVESGAYATPEYWPIAHPRPWISDPSGNIVYSAHAYFDGYGAASSNYAQALASAVNEENSVGGWGTSGSDALVRRARYRVGTFVNWCRSFGVACNLGEIGWYILPASDVTAWNTLGNTIYADLNAAGMGAIYWAAGRFYEKYHGSAVYIYLFGAYKLDSTLNSTGQPGTGTYPVPGYTTPAPSPLPSAPVIEAPANLTR